MKIVRPRINLEAIKSFILMALLFTGVGFYTGIHYEQNQTRTITAQAHALAQRLTDKPASK